MKKTPLLLLVGLFCAFTSAFAGSGDFGKVKVEDLRSSKYRLDPEAEAHVIYDKGYTRIDLDPVSNDFVLYFDREIRIKIYSKEGFDKADFTIPLHKQLGLNEQINSLKATTYTLEGNKMSKTKLDRKDVYEEDLGGATIYTKFTMPNVKEGSIIEVEYQVKSDIFWRIPTWEFQSDIPVQYSEYQVDVPEYFFFKENVTGYAPLAQVDKTSRTFNFRLGAQSISRGGSWQSGPQNGAPETVTCSGSSMYYLGKNMPALRDEPFMTTYHDYTSKVNLQIEGVQMPGSAYRSVMSDWNNIIDNWMKRDTYARQFDRKWMDEVLAPLQAKHSGTDLAVAIYEHVKNHMNHNNLVSYYPDASLKKIYGERQGTTAEINFLLTALLKKAGFTAVPVILSTRDHGRVHPVYPFMEEYNYMISELIVDNQRIFLDATYKMLPFGMLPVHALNERGHEMLPGGQYVSLRPAAGHTEFTMAKGTIGEDGSLKLDVSESRKNYGAYSWRQEMAEAGGEDAYKASLKNKFEGWEVSDIQIENASNLYDDISRKYSLVSEDKAQANAGTIYIEPILLGAEEENIFKLEDRVFPVDIPYPTQSTYMLTLTLPEGYTMVEAPQPQQVTLPNNGGSYTYQIMQNGNMVQVVSKLNLNQLAFPPNEYPNLRKFYEMIIAKQAETIVLQKQ
ncbi:DUF3858 domain-containing protein [Roseivirga sp. BDSF3-8]|uniref:DUF3858 domain-containing protein n=1 Tax=Roseivirga sp. BDSF3-8 TaxID=3241598 RepID=UPI003531EA81